MAPAQEHIQIVRLTLRLLRLEAEALLRAANTNQALTEARGHVLGRNSTLRHIRQSIPALPADHCPAIGRLCNEAHQALETLIADRRAELSASHAHPAAPGSPEKQHHPQDWHRQAPLPENYRKTVYPHTNYLPPD